MASRQQEGAAPHKPLHPPTLHHTTTHSHTKISGTQDQTWKNFFDVFRGLLGEGLRASGLSVGMKEGLEALGLTTVVQKKGKKNSKKENWGHQDRKLKIELNVSNDTDTPHVFLLRAAPRTDKDEKPAHKWWAVPWLSVLL